MGTHRRWFVWILAQGGKVGLMQNTWDPQKLGILDGKGMEAWSLCKSRTRWVSLSEKRSPEDTVAAGDQLTAVYLEGKQEGLDARS